eukprot:scaffold248544_cov65-Cyclotella_meneghiniana.AAC.4
MLLVGANGVEDIGRQCVVLIVGRIVFGWMMDMTHTTHHVKVGHAAEDDEEVHQSQERHSDGDATAHCSKLLLLCGAAAAAAVGYTHVWHLECEICLLLMLLRTHEIDSADLLSVYSRGVYVRQLKEKNIDVRVMDLAGKKKKDL